mmetsp:Transcript_107355/g.346704  ORF Transcript_107355/g.346704 Transcript_107355/m.346704 type:complete len:98 (+) Transcript_107355:3-296(+)
MTRSCMIPVRLDELLDGWPPEVQPPCSSLHSHLDTTLLSMVVQLVRSLYIQRCTLLEWRLSLNLGEKVSAQQVKSVAEVSKIVDWLQEVSKEMQETS